MEIETFIIKTRYGHTVCFKIGVQTFRLPESVRENKDYGSLRVARWTKKQLDEAFNLLI